MATKKPTNPPVHVENCSFVAQASPANEHTRDAVVALAGAIKANAEAVVAAAEALKGAAAIMETGMRIG
jgi:hypothetical protein